MGGSLKGSRVGAGRNGGRKEGRERGRPLRAAAARALTGEESRESREVSLTKIGSDSFTKPGGVMEDSLKNSGRSLCNFNSTLFKNSLPRPSGWMQPYERTKDFQRSRDLRLENNFYFFCLDSNVV